MALQPKSPNFATEKGIREPAVRRVSSAPGEPATKGQELLA